MTGGRSLRARWLLLFLWFVLLPASAQAHTTIKGLGEVINGLVHPFMTPSHMMVLLGLGLLLGQQSPPTFRMPLLVFVPLSAAGLLFTLTGLVTTVYQPILVGLALLTGALVALEKPPPRPASIALFGVAAMAVGLDSAVEAGTTFAALKTLFGTWMSLGLLVFDFAFYASLLSHKHWQRIGVRVVGSWLTAISLMVLAFALKR